MSLKCSGLDDSKKRAMLPSLPESKKEKDKDAKSVKWSSAMRATLVTEDEDD
jgi:hypothetical protein